MRYIAHIRECDHQDQYVEDHLHGVQSLAERYGERIGIKHIAGLAGMLHDMGKYTDKFRDYILEAVRNPDAPPRRGSVDHSTAGGRLLYQLFHNKEKGLLAELVGNAIISHHSYLHDFIDPNLELKYLQRVRDKQDVEDYDKSVELFFERVMNEKEFNAYVDKAVEELKQFRAVPSTLSSEAKCMFLSKYIFSALIDADRTNTRQFEENVTEDMESTVPTDELFPVYYDRLLNEIQSFAEQAGAQSPIYLLRSQMSEQCDQFADNPPGIYTLSIPTGGGKTLASLRYALKHAIKYNKKHIIYVLPYTTIIEQNAAEVRRILQNEAHILEHHSNVIEEDDEDDEQNDGIMNVRQKLKLAKDNWDTPIIFTTMVQFLDVFYAKSSKSIRRLHNLSESVIIFDEVQKVPVSCISLFNEALNFLSAYCHTSIVLCTATQPALDFVQHKLNVSQNAEIIHNLDHMIEAFKRVGIVDYATNNTYTNDTLAALVTEKIQEKQSVLVILNTKSVVKKLYQELKVANPDLTVFHLSTSMCSAHRKVILGIIRDQLRDGEKLICISTPLIEAGVDVSFECVIRSLAGLDSIAQAAGRCNRHGEKELQEVYVIDHTEENLNHLKEIKIGRKITQRMLIDLQRDPTCYGGHLLSLQAMKSYFQNYYTDMQSLLDYQIPRIGRSVTSLLFAKPIDNTYLQDYQTNRNQRPPQFLMNSYRTAAQYFHVIDNPASSVIVPYGEEGQAIIAELNGAERIQDFTRLLRSAQQYTVNLFDYELQKLDKNGGIQACLDGQMLVLTEGAYHEEFGLDMDNDSWSGLTMF